MSCIRSRLCCRPVNDCVREDRTGKPLRAEAGNVIILHPSDFPATYPALGIFDRPILDCIAFNQAIGKRPRIRVEHKIPCPRIDERPRDMRQFDHVATKPPSPRTV